jgi:hypothetical protein
MPNANMLSSMTNVPAIEFHKPRPNLELQPEERSQQRSRPRAAGMNCRSSGFQLVPERGEGLMIVAHRFPKATGPISSCSRLIGTTNNGFTDIHTYRTDWEHPATV